MTEEELIVQEDEASGEGALAPSHTRSKFAVKVQELAPKPFRKRLQEHSSVQLVFQFSQNDTDFFNKPHTYFFNKAHTDFFNIGLSTENLINR